MVASYLCLVIWVWIFGLIVVLVDDGWFIVGVCYVRLVAWAYDLMFCLLRLIGVDYVLLVSLI